MPMAGKRKKNRNVDWQAAERLEELLADKGWLPRDVAAASEKTGNPLQAVSARTVYRVLDEGHRPNKALQYEIACALGVLPSQIWGNRPLPDRMAPAPELVPA